MENYFKQSHACKPSNTYRYIKDLILCKIFEFDDLSYIKDIFLMKKGTDDYFSFIGILLNMSSIFQNPSLTPQKSTKKRVKYISNLHRLTTRTRTRRWRGWKKLIMVSLSSHFFSFNFISSRSLSKPFLFVPYVNKR